MSRPEIRTPRLSIGLSIRGGRGVFAERPFAPGEIIERAPVIVLPRSQAPLLNQTVLGDYYFEWDEDGTGNIAIGLGFSSIYNHSFDPVAKYTKHYAAMLLEYVAVRHIAPGEEITVNYNGDPRDRSPLWFPATP